MTENGTPELHTARLLLRKIRAADADDLFRAGSLGKTQDEARLMVENMMKYNDDPMNYHWVLDYRGHAIGRIKGWEVNPRDAYIQLGYDVAEAYRSQGFMTEALCAVCRYLLKQAGFHRVFCTVRETNLPSIRVCEKAGLVLDGILREHFRQPDGTFVDARVYSLLSNEIPEKPFPNC